MKIFHTIRGRYTLAFGGLALIFLVVVISTEALVHYLQNSMGKYASGASLIQNADRDLYQSRLALSTFLFAHEAQSKEDVLLNAQQAFDRMQQFRQLTGDITEITHLLAKFEATYQHWFSNTTEIMDQNNDVAMMRFIDENQTAFINLRSLYDESEGLIGKYATLERQTINEYTNRFKLIVGVLAIGVLLLSISLAWFAPRNISRAIKQVTFGVRQISSGDGDLTRRINSTKPDETGELSRELDSVVARRGSVIGQVRYGCEHIRQEMSHLGESASSSADLSERQNQALEFIVTAVEEMGGATREVAQNAANTVAEVEELNRSADKGVMQLDNGIAQLDRLSAQIQQAAIVINQLSDRSDRIASVLDVILSISEQTNLLALNAAIEAARAGEQGRGFAVVADEVRNLASKTQASTEDIQSMINDLQSGVRNAVSSIKESVEMTQVSVELSHKTMDSIAIVKTSAGRIYDFTAQTASATEEQSKVTDEINENLSNLSAMSKEVMNISKRISHSVHETLTNSNELAGQVKRFTV